MKRRLAIGRPVAVLLVLFLVVGLLVMTGRTARFDQAVLAALRDPGQPGLADLPRWVVGGARQVTHAGDPGVRAVLAAFGALLLLAVGRARAALALGLAWGGGTLTVDLLKIVVARARPEIAWRLIEVRAMSFPSGHATGAMLLYPLLGYCLGGLAGPRQARAGALAGIACALVVGLTRVLLGVHWMSDVLGGWLLGGAIAWFAARAGRVSRR